MFDMSSLIIDLSHVIYSKNFDQSGCTSNILKCLTKFKSHNALEIIFDQIGQTFLNVMEKILKQNSNSNLQIQILNYLTKFKSQNAFEIIFDQTKI